MLKRITKKQSCKNDYSGLFDVDLVLVVGHKG